MSTFITALAQINPLVGDIDGNLRIIIDYAWRAHKEHNAHLVVFPELCLTGYPPEDLLLRPSLAPRIDAALAALVRELPDIAVVVGYPKTSAGGLFNAAAIIQGGKVQLEYAKQNLPNYQVFDEKRYFVAGDHMPVFQYAGHSLAITICEDIWHPGPAQQAKAAGASLIINLNASPFHRHKQHEREVIVGQRCIATGLPVIYVNQVGGQDELVFDGCSMVLDGQGQVQMRAPAFTEGLYVAHVSSGTPQPGMLAPPLSDLASVYQALVLGVGDYVRKNKFKGVVLGLSGGIDSALTMAIAVDALGAQQVEAVMMPFRYTSQLSQDDAAKQAELMGVRYSSVSIEGIYNAFTTALAPAFAGLAVDKTEENLQARSRGVILMALSNKSGTLVLTTGNKSEMSVGYATLYGDMAGGLDVLKDVPKTLVFALAEYRNQLQQVIPPSVISRPPSAELAPDQKDEDSLPPYPVLDAILAMYIEQDASASAIIAEGFAPEVVYKVLRMVDVNEYKRRQAAIGIRISQRGFGRDRRYPITNGWRIGD